MQKVTKMDYERFRNMCGFEIDDESNFEYYSISDGYFVAYDNEFHKNHKYIYFKFDFKKTKNLKDVYNQIKTYFNKSLQIMVDSKETATITMISESGFKLRRRSFERCFKEIDIKKHLDIIEDIKLIKSIDSLYEEAVIKAYNHYVETHKEINPLTVNIETFRSVLPNDVYLQIEDDKIINYVFVEENELCYMGSEKLNTFDGFVYTIIKEVLKTNEEITFEADDTDEVAMKLKQLFNDKSTDSFNTYILN